MFNCPKCRCDNSSIAIVCQKCGAWMPYAIPYVKEEWRKYLASEKRNPTLTIDECKSMPMWVAIDYVRNHI